MNTKRWLMTSLCTTSEVKSCQRYAQAAAAGAWQRKPWPNALLLHHHPPPAATQLACVTSRSMIWRMERRSLPSVSSVRRTIWGWQQLCRSAASAAMLRDAALLLCRCRPPCTQWPSGCLGVSCPRHLQKSPQIHAPAKSSWQWTHSTHHRPACLLAQVEGCVKEASLGLLVHQPLHAAELHPAVLASAGRQVQLARCSSKRGECSGGWVREQD